MTNSNPLSAAPKGVLPIGAGPGRSLAAWLSFFCFLSIAIVPWLLMFEMVKFSQALPALLAWLVIGFLAAGATSSEARRV